MTVVVKGFAYSPDQWEKTIKEDALKIEKNTAKNNFCCIVSASLKTEHGKMQNSFQRAKSELNYINYFFSSFY